MDVDNANMKRPADETEENGVAKRHSPEDEADIIYRILCPTSRIGSLIGKNGSIIKQLRSETGARIKVADKVGDVEERVVHIGALDTPNTDWSPAQEALFRVHGRIIEGDKSETGEPVDVGITTTRLLVPSAQIGCLIGKGGAIINQMREETGATIRILGKDQLPGCALHTDELVQIVGELTVARKALHNISARLRANPSRGQTDFHASRGGAAGEPLVAHLRNTGLGASPYAGSSGYGAGMVGAMMPGGRLPASAGGEVTFRLLCPNERIGGVIGKAGSIVKQIRSETGARVKVENEVPGVEERVITISGIEEPGAHYSPAAEALFRINQRIIEGDRPQVHGTVPTARLLVPSTQVGCLIGKKGNIISQMRMETRANIKILPKEQLPGCALPGDELVQIQGEYLTLQAALLVISARLRATPPRDGSTAAGAGGAYVPASPYRGSPAQAGYQSGGEQAAGEGGSVSRIGMVSMQMTVTNAAVGTIIGTEGRNIAQIRQRSGARVRVGDTQQSTPDERVVEIAGTAEQTQAAQQLIQALVISSQQRDGPAEGQEDSAMATF